MLKKQIYDSLEFGENPSRFAIYLNIFIIVLIIISSISIIFSSITNFFDPEFFYPIELLSVVVFTIEYVLRLWSCTENEKFKKPITGRIRYALTPLAIIDFLAIIPFYLPLIIGVDLRILRILRLLRIFRLFKLARYTKSFDLLKRVLNREKEALILTFFILFLVIIIASSLMYYAENSAQPDLFSSIPHAMWWAVASLTTVGYGDIYPITPIGKLMASIIALIGIGFVALPTGIISSGYVEEIRKSREKENKTGTINELERIALLHNEGYLTKEEFEKLKIQIIDKS